MSDLFYVIGIVLVVLALVVTAVGLRMHDFPRSRGVVLGGLTAFALLVALTCTYAVVLAREEKEHREEEWAEWREEHAEEQEGTEAAADPESEATAEEGGAQGENLETEGGDQAGGEGETIELTSPEDGSLVFDPEALEAAAGSVTIDYTNPSDVPHNVALEVEGETVAEGDVVTGGDVSSVSYELEPGTYVFYCSVPGHREAGMEGELRVR
ncbi:MAG TPA: plastocyanin/azurin family copper-binding protein [Solirubrobacterales bacterium]|mgnify:CR=1 FL=1|jgi:plastocyanin